jgi:uncharacterized membrane protein
MQTWLMLKTLHILSATLLFGTGLGTAFFMWRAHQGGDVRAIATVSRNVVLADWWFTTPAVILQPLTGFAMLYLVGLDWRLGWVLASLVLYLVAGACWLPVVAIQMRVADLAAVSARSGTPLPAAYFRLMRWWFALGWPAFIAVLLVFWLMVAKPDLRF